MRGLKMILTGFLFTFTGISFLILLTIPNAPLILTGPVTISTAGGAISELQLSTQDYLNVVNFIHTVEVISFLLIIGGIILAGLGAFRKDG